MRINQLNANHIEVTGVPANTVWIDNGETGGPILNSGDFFQSYGHPVAFVEHAGEGRTFLDSRYWDYSKTTMKHLAAWMGMSAKEIRARVESGEFHVVDALNGFGD